MRGFVAWLVVAALVACAPQRPPPTTASRPAQPRTTAEAPEPSTEPPLLRLVPQSGHVSEIWALAFSPDGRWLASGGLDHAIYVWSREGLLLAELLGHREAITSLSWKPDGSRIVSSARDGRMIVWDLDRAEPAFVIEQPAFSVAWSPDGETLASVGPKAEILLWAASDGRLLRRAEATSGRQLLAVGYGPDGRRIATRSLDGHVHFWDAESLAVSTPVQLSSGYTRRVVFGGAGRRLALANRDRIAIFDAASGAVTREVPLATDYPSPIGFTDDDRTLIAVGQRGVVAIDAGTGRLKPLFSGLGIVEASALAPDAATLATSHDVDGQIRLWRLSDGTPTGALGAPSSGAHAASFSPDGATIATFGGPSQIWDARTGRVSALLEHGMRAGRGAFSADGALIAADVRDGVGVWSANGKRVALIKARTDDHSPHFAWSPDGQQLAVGVDRALFLWSRDQQRVTRTVKLARAAAAVEWSPNGELLAIGAASSIELWDAKRWRIDRTLDMKQLAAWAAFRTLDFSPDGRRLVASSDSQIAVWELSSGRIAAVRKRAFHAVPRFSPDSRAVAFSAPDHTVELWDGIGPDAVTLTGSPSAIRVVAWQPRGRLVAAACDDGVVRVWDTRGRLVREFPGHEGRVWDLAWHPGGEVLLAASHQARLHRLRDGKTLVLRARIDAASGVVHEPNGAFDGDPDAFGLLKVRRGRRFDRMEMLAAEQVPELCRPGLARAFWAAP